MTPLTAAGDLEHIIEDLPLPREERLALDASLKRVEALREVDALDLLDDLARGLGDRYGTKHPRVGRELAEFRAKLVRARGEARRRLA